MAAVPTTGRATAVEPTTPPEAESTRALFEQYGRQVFGYCLHQLGSREEAEDAVQSTFLNAFRGLRRGVVPEQEAAWLFKIAQNVCLTRRRSTWRRGRIESPADFDAVEQTAAAPARNADELFGMREALEQLPESQRRAILLREWQGLSYREIAAELDLSQAAVETLIFRARRSLAQRLERPVEQLRRARVRAGADLGSFAAALKSLLAGGAAVKAAGAAAVVALSTVAVAASEHGPRRHDAPPAAARAGQVEPAPARPPVATAPASPARVAPSSVPALRRALPARVASARHVSRRAAHVARPVRQAGGGRALVAPGASSQRGGERVAHGAAVRPHRSAPKRAGVSGVSRRSSRPAAQAPAAPKPAGGTRRHQPSHGYTVRHARPAAKVAVTGLPADPSQLRGGGQGNGNGGGGGKGDGG